MPEPVAPFYFYRRQGVPAEVPPLPPGYTARYWRPHGFGIVPPGMRMIPGGIWWAFHQLRIFANRGYAISLIYAGGQLVHRSMVFPGYFRFPFMERGDLQIGDTWTDEAHRGRGLATLGLLYALQAGAAAEAVPFWYIVERNNLPSIRVVEKAGFERVGEGHKQPRCGLALLGEYRLKRSVAAVIRSS